MQLLGHCPAPATDAPGCAVVQAQEALLLAQTRLQKHTRDIMRTHPRTRLIRQVIWVPSRLVRVLTMTTTLMAMHSTANTRWRDSIWLTKPAQSRRAVEGHGRPSSITLFSMGCTLVAISCVSLITVLERVFSTNIKEIATNA